MARTTGELTASSASLRVPLSDPGRGWAEQEPALREALDRVFRAGSFILGQEVSAFEREFAAYCGAGDAVAVASGTDALILALAGLGIEAGDEVITSALSSSATPTAIARLGARPVFVDIDPATNNLDLEQLAAHLRPSVGAIVPVHLYGRPVEMQPLLELAAERGLAVVEDACQAHGAVVMGRKVGSLGTAGCFSFYPTKNLGAFGDAGMIICSDAALADRLRELRQYGWRERDRSEVLGFNSRLDEVQAAFLRVKLPRLDGWNQRRREIAGRYDQGLAGLEGIRLPLRSEGHVFHLYVVRVGARDALRARLAARGILTGVHYPVALHQQPAFKSFGGNAPLPQAERACAEVLSLPIFPQLSDGEVDAVIGAVRESVRS
jgi:dTDP-4-amino-4,6-dideoxygalactose transaminase